MLMWQEVRQPADRNYTVWDNQVCWSENVLRATLQQ
jgi:hypothetical protein